MNFLQKAEWRYTTKLYDPSQKIKPKDIQQLQEILRLCPSSINSQPWRFVFVEDEAIKSRLAAKSFYNEEKINQAPLLIVFLVNDNIQNFEELTIKNMPESKQEYYFDHKAVIGLEGVRNWMQKQLYISLGFCLSACACMDLDSSPMEGIEPNSYKEILEFEDYLPLFAVAVGYRDDEDYNQPSKKPKTRRELVDVVRVI